MAIQIRTYNDKDKAILADAVEQLHDYVVALDPVKRLRKMPGYVAHEVDEILETVKKQHGTIYIAEDNGEFVGFTAGFIAKQTEENLLHVVPTKIGVTSDLFVSEPYRKKGIGEMLIKKMENFLKESGCDTLWIRIVAFNTNAHTFYKKMGYHDREIGLMKHT